MKTRVQVYLEPEQDLLLEGLASLRGVSKAGLIRQSIDRYLETIPVEEDPALQLIGLAKKTGIKDLSQKHDEHLASFERRSNELPARRSS